MELRSEGKLLEAQRLLARTKYDLEMIEEVGFCNGIENYSRYMDGRRPGERPFTLIDYFDYAPPGGGRRFRGAEVRPSAGSGAHLRGGRASVRGDARERGGLAAHHRREPRDPAAGAGDVQRRQGAQEVLVDHGFRLPSALDNRPLRFEEFEAMVPQTVYVRQRPGRTSSRSAGRGRRAGDPPDGAARPGDRDPPGEGAGAGPDRGVPGARGGGRARAGDGADQAAVRGPDELPRRAGPAVRYLHSEVETLDRIEIITDLRGRVRRAGRREPAARGARPARGERSCASSTPTRRGSCARRRA
jgi:excinuclease ABC subunit B